jgi:hypothetical protein
MHAVDLAGDASGFERGLNQRGIAWIILKVKDAQGGFHW